MTHSAFNRSLTSTATPVNAVVKYPWKWSILRGRDINIWLGPTPAQQQPRICKMHMFAVLLHTPHVWVQDRSGGQQGMASPLQTPRYGRQEATRHA